MSDLAASISGAPRASRWGLFALVSGAVAIGFSGIWVRLSELGPTATSFHRLALALPVLWLWSAWMGTRTEPHRKPARAADYIWLVAAGLFFAADMMAWAWAVTLTTVANATLFANFAPIVVTLAAWLLFGERVTLVFVLGLGLALAGATVLLGVSFGAGTVQVSGDALGLLAALFYGAYLLTVSRLRARFSTATIMLFTAGAGAAALLPAAMFMDEGLFATTLFGWLVLIVFAWTGQVAGHGLIAWSLAHLPASFGSVALLMQPVTAAVVAWLILGEALGPMQIAGGVVVLAGIALARQGSTVS
ncbi:MAG: DMT family transporter [Alphaproteobacteria bacterium]|nr:DMT family transporter [Alphaproteobacteria bacterium]